MAVYKKNEADITIWSRDMVSFCKHVFRPHFSLISQFSVNYEISKNLGFSTLRTTRFFYPTHPSQKVWHEFFGVENDTRGTRVRSPDTTSVFFACSDLFPAVLKQLSSYCTSNFFNFFYFVVTTQYKHKKSYLVVTTK